MFYKNFLLLTVLWVVVACFGCTSQYRASSKKETLYTAPMEEAQQEELAVILERVLKDSDALIDDINYTRAPDERLQKKMEDFSSHIQELLNLVEGGDASLEIVDESLRRIDYEIGAITPLLRNERRSSRLWGAVVQRVEKLKDLATKVSGDGSSEGERLVGLVDELTTPVTRLRTRAREEGASPTTLEAVSQFKDDLDEALSRIEQDLANQSLVLDEAKKIVERWRRVRNTLWEKDPSIFDSQEWTTSHQMIRGIQRELRRVQWRAPQPPHRQQRQRNSDDYFTR